MNVNLYDEWCACYDPENKEMDVLFRHNIDFRNKRVLEVGCGSGRFTKSILKTAAFVYAIDPDSKAIEYCKKTISHPSVVFEVGELKSLPEAEESFDYVVFSWSMYLIPDKEQALRISRDYLVSGGKTIVLQTSYGEYEGEVSALYTSYSSLGAYDKANSILQSTMMHVFGNVVCDYVRTYLQFESIDMIVRLSVFFVEDEEGALPSDEQIAQFRERIARYRACDGTYKLSDVVSLFISQK